MDMRLEMEDICHRYNIADLYVFGSRAREIADRINGKAVVVSHCDSDVDIGVLPAESGTWNPEKKVDLTITLEDLLQVDRIDLVMLPEAEPYLALDIIRGELLFSRDPDSQARYELYVLRRAGDLIPFKKERTRMILEEEGR